LIVQLGGVGGGGNVPWAAICARRQAGHQQPAASDGTATAGGSAMHQHGWSLPSVIAQANCAPQRVHVLIAPPRGGRCTKLRRTTGKSWQEYSSECCHKIQQDAARSPQGLRCFYSICL